MLTSRPGTTITFFGARPASTATTFSSLSAAFSTSAASVSAGTVIRLRTRPFTWMGYSTVSSTSNAGSGTGNGS
jgi:hypothetical protein